MKKACQQEAVPCDEIGRTSVGQQTFDILVSDEGVQLLSGLWFSGDHSASWGFGQPLIPIVHSPSLLFKAVAALVCLID